MQARLPEREGSTIRKQGQLIQYGTVEIDFVRRTFAILDQYDRHVLPSVSREESYEVTLLLNCLLGLVVLPFEHLKRTKGGKGSPRICEDDQLPVLELSDEWGMS